MWRNVVFGVTQAVDQILNCSVTLQLLFVIRGVSNSVFGSQLSSSVQEDKLRYIFFNGPQHHWHYRSQNEVYTRIITDQVEWNILRLFFRGCVLFLSL